MTNNKLKKIISSICFLVIIIHIIFPKLSIDSIVVTLLIIGIVPWLSPLFKSFTAAGIGVEYKDFEEIEKKFKENNFLKYPKKNEKIFYPSFKSEDPILSLAWLRIEIEKRIKILNDLCNLPQNKDIYKLLSQLKNKEILSEGEFSSLRALRGILNRAVHGGKINSKIGDWSLKNGQNILFTLDEKIKIYEESCNL